MRKEYETVQEFLDANLNDAHSFIANYDAELGRKMETKTDLQKIRAEYYSAAKKRYKTHCLALLLHAANSENSHYTLPGNRASYSLYPAAESPRELPRFLWHSQRVFGNLCSQGSPGEGIALLADVASYYIDNRFILTQSIREEKPLKQLLEIENKLLSHVLNVFLEHTAYERQRLQRIGKLEMKKGNIALEAYWIVLYMLAEIALKIGQGNQWLTTITTLLTRKQLFSKDVQFIRSLIEAVRYTLAQRENTKFPEIYDYDDMRAKIFPTLNS